MIDISRRPRKCRVCRAFDHDARNCPELNRPPPRSSDDPPRPPLRAKVLPALPLTEPTATYVTLIAGDEYARVKALASAHGCSVGELMRLLLDGAGLFVRLAELETRVDAMEGNRKEQAA